MANATVVLRDLLVCLAVWGVSLGACADDASGSTSTVVYFNDFNSGISEQISGAGRLNDVAGFAGVGNAGNQFGGQYLVNDTGYIWRSSNPTPGSPSVLTLTGLADHSAINLSFLLAIRDTWDGSYRASNPTEDFANFDYFNVAVDGVTVFSETFGIRNTLGYTDYVQSYAAPSGVLLTGSGANAVNYGGGSFVDSAYDMGLDPSFQSIAHSGSTLTLSFWADGPGWQGRAMGSSCLTDTCADESWAIDNLSVSLIQTVPVTPVPEPEVYAMMMAGLGLIGALARRRKQRDLFV